MARTSNLTMCSFCGKSHAEVRKLIAGPGVYICDSCITVCKGILDKEVGEVPGGEGGHTKGEKILGFDGRKNLGSILGFLMVG